MKKILIFLMTLSSILGANSLQEIKDSKLIRIGIRHALPPFSDQDSKGNSEGFEVELAKAIGREILGDGGEIRLVILEAKDRIPFLQENKIDLAIANLDKTPEREKDVDFSVPYLLNYLSVLTKKADNVKKITDLTAKKVLFIKGTTTEDYIKTGNLRADWVECSGKMDCFRKLQNGNGDGYMHVNTLISTLPLIDNNLELGISKISSQVSQTCVGADKGNSELIDAVNEAIFKLSKNGFFKAQYENFLEPHFQGTIAKNHLILEDLYKTLHD